ncbi:MAG: fatty acid desaturase family protein [Myxococcaceae bacterium]
MNLLPVSKVRELSKLSPARAAGQIALEYLGITFAIFLCERFWHPALYLVTFAFLGARYLALAVLMHDAAHYRLFANRAVNDWVGSYLCGAPALLSMQDYRHGHLAHHAHLGTPEDPELPFRKMVSVMPQAGVLIVGSLIGISGLMLVVSVNRGFKRALGLATIPAVLLLAWLAPSAARLIALYWLLPYFLWTAGANVLRTFAEHYDVDLEHASTPERVYAARVIRPSWLARLFIAPNNVGYHLDHHLYPSVPFYRLPELHALLLEHAGYRERTRDFTGYPDVISDHLSRVRSAEAPRP